eukprot:gene19348-21267_t
MTELDSQGLHGRAVAARKQKKGCFVSKGPDWVQSLDGHCKRMGYQRCTFPLAVYGCLDTASRKLFWIPVWTENCEPNLIGRWYLDYLYSSRVLSFHKASKWIKDLKQAKWPQCMPTYEVSVAVQ